jgi:probable rRNA maturation factor
MDPASSLIFERAPRRLRRRELRAFAERLRREVGGGRPFSCLLTSDSGIRRLNRKFRGKDEPTDVLSFPAARPDFLGDIAISTDRAAEQAREQGHSLDAEIRVLLLHGLLHLTGLDHERDRGRMRRVEQRWRRRLELPAGLLERTRA